MFSRNSSLFIIAFALFALLAMQAMWLYYAVKQEKKFLEEGTRKAALETLAVLEQKEDTRIIMQNLDSVNVFSDSAEGGKDKKAEIKVVVANGHKKMRVVKGLQHTVTSSYSYRQDGKGNSEIRILNNENELNLKSENGKAKVKMADYDKLLKKIFLQSEVGTRELKERVNFSELSHSIRQNLKTRGIDIEPAMAVMNGKDSVIFKSEDYSAGADMVFPMFTRDIVFQDYSLHLFFPSSFGYTLKRAFGVIAMSLAVTVLLVTVILMLYKRMLTEKKLNKYKNDFINNLTHELKTPLATIALANSNIARSAESDAARINQYTNIIEEESHKLNQHIEKVLELSLLEKDKHIFHEEKNDLHELIRKSLEQNLNSIHEKNAQTELVLKAEKHFAKVDAFHFMNALGNLIDNALKYCKEQVKISIKTFNRDGNIYLCIADNGIGISEENQKRVFDKFFRVTENNLHPTKGFGIGLSYVKQSIEHFGGKIEVRSELNKGSEFIISLPYV